MQEFALALWQALTAPVDVPSAVMVGITIGAHFAGYHAVRREVRKQGRKIDSHETAIILTTPEPHRGAVLEILAKGKK